jgi:REP element-mobilizing transposase RayT
MPYSELYVHLVWTTYERSALIRHDIEEALWALIATQCKRLGAIALRVGGMPDHIHLLATYSPNLAQTRAAGFSRLRTRSRALQGSADCCSRRCTSHRRAQPAVHPPYRAPGRTRHQQRPASILIRAVVLDVAFARLEPVAPLVL